VNQLRVLSLTTLMLMLASRLPGQAYGRPQYPEGGLYIQPVVCNDGTSSFFVARAYQSVWFGKQPWLIQGWYEVKTGTCQKIGSDSNPDIHYSSTKNIFGIGDDAVSLLAFAFFDAKGVWGAAKVPVGGAYESSNQQFCVTDGDAFGYRLKGEQSDLSRQCQAGYHLIPASVAFYGYSFRPHDPGDRDYLHVRLGPSDRAISLGPSSSSQTSSNTPAPKPSGDSGDSVGTQLLKALAKSAAEERQKQAQRQAQVAAAAPPGGFARFVDGCNAFYRDPANARLSMSDAPGWCGCLSEQYRNLMTPEEESKYANNFERLFHGGIAQPYGFGLSKSDPAWPRLHPAVDKCAR
jgi:hypothetical protein